MLRLLVCLPLFATLVSARKYCCMPQQWEGYEGITMGMARRDAEPRLIEMGMKVSYDGTNKRIAVFMEEHGAKVHIIQDYVKNIQYSIRNSTCTKTRLGPFNDGCIPDSATRIGPMYYGSGKQTLEVYSYMGVDKNLKYFLSATSKECVPVSEMITGKMGRDTVMMGVGFANIKPGIKDPKVFNVPESCDKGDVHNVNLGERKPSSIFGV